MIRTNKFKLSITNEKRRVIENILSLGVLNVANYILPLLSIPYVLRVIGVENFGLLSIVGVIVSYITLFSDFGFNFYATRKISINRDNLLEVTNIYSSILTCKILIVLFLFIILISTLFVIGKPLLEINLYFAHFGILVGQAFFPIWLFQGLEKMKSIVFINLVSKIILTILIFMLLKARDEYILFPILTSISFLVTGLLGLYFAKYVCKINYKKPNFNDIKNHLNESKHFFISNLSISLYTNISPLILGFYSSTVFVGYYSAADKFIQIGKNALSPISQSLYPILSLRFSSNSGDARGLINKLLVYSGSISGLISLVIFLLAEELITIILGREYLHSIIALQILSPIPFIVTLSNIFAVQGLYNMGKSVLVSRYISLVSIFHVLMLIYLSQNYKHIGASFSILTTEIIILLLSFYFYKKN